VGKLNLGKVIQKANASEHEAEIAALQAKTPYSQTLHNLNNGSNAALLKYDWIIGHTVTPAKKIPDDIFTIDTIRVKAKKKKAKKKGSSIYAKEIITLTGIMGGSARKAPEEKELPSEIVETPETEDIETVDQMEVESENIQTLASTMGNTDDEADPIDDQETEDESNKVKTDSKKKKEKKKPKKEATNKSTKKPKKAKKDKTSKKKSSTKNQKTKSGKAKNSSSKKNKKENKEKGWRVFTEEQRVELNDFTNWLNSLGSSENPESKAEKPIKSKKTKAEKTKKKVKSKAKKAKKKDKISEKIDSSVIKKDEIVSESLAALYNQQGHYKKALKAYKRLSLINPEKSSFFAPLIEDLKKKV